MIEQDNDKDSVYKTIIFAGQRDNKHHITTVETPMAGAENNVVVILDSNNRFRRKTGSSGQSKTHLAVLKGALSANQYPAFASYLKLPHPTQHSKYSGGKIKLTQLNESGTEVRSLIRKMHEDPKQASTRSLIEVELRNGFKFTVGKSVVYNLIQMKSNFGDEKLQILFQPSKYLDDSKSIWKLRQIIGKERFKTQVEQNSNVIDSVFIRKVLKQSTKTFLFSSDFKEVYDVRTPGITEGLTEIPIAESLKYLTIDQMEKVIEKTHLAL